MNINQNSLLVVDSPYLLYVYSLINCKDNIDILVVLGENYSVEEFEKFISYLVPDSKVGNISFFKDSFNWNTERNASSIASVISSLEINGINENKIKSYNHIYLNSYGSAIGFYLSTLRTYIAIQHSIYDILRHFPIKYFIETVKFFIRTKKIRHRFEKFCIANTLENPPSKFCYFKPFGVVFNDKFYQSYILENSFNASNQDIGILLWTNHYSYDDPFNIEFIKLNLHIFEAAYKDYSNNLDCLIIKLHHRIPRPNNKELARIKFAFEKSGLKVILFDEIFNYQPPSRIYPIEMFVSIFKTSIVVGACSAAVWNCSEKSTYKTYSAFEYSNSKVGRLEFVIKGWKSINKNLKYIPYDLSANLNESN